jgi:CDP-4-dehydro-6-deoxyglucose reductase, E1
MISKSLSKLVEKEYRHNFPAAKFIPGKSTVPVSGKVFDKAELLNGVTAIMEGWWTEGKFSQAFEKEFSKLIGVKYVTLVNSGSSANLLAISALSSAVFGDRALKPGDEIITSACGFPTTINPIIQNRCIPVFVDIDLNTKNPSVDQIAEAISPKTKAIILAHTLGNPFAIARVRKLADKHKLWLIEDACDALGSIYHKQMVGSFGDIASFSFYPAHQITMGEGGAVVTSNPLIYRALRQFRDWGRDCWCNTGEDNTCQHRFKWKMGDLPLGYDHKYIYSQIGYNLKLTDMQSAIGLAQLAKLPDFIKRRNFTFNKYLKYFSRYPEYFILTKSESDSRPCWFGFTLVISDQAPFSKIELVDYLENHHIATRSLFAGNITKHPAYMSRTDIRIAGKLDNSDKVMQNGFWFGVYPGITAAMSDYVIKIFSEFLKSVGGKTVV